MKNFMTLTIENETRRNEIENAYNEAMCSSDIKSFVRSMDVNTNDDVMVGISGSHIWISEVNTGRRFAIITNLFS